MPRIVRKRGGDLDRRHVRQRWLSPRSRTRYHVRKRPDGSPDARYIVLVSLASLDPNACYRALRARDRRFDGAFFVAVHSTGIYCRPICPARPVAFDRCTFYGRAAEAEREGYRACFRCRPELAPGLAPMDSTPRLVRRAAAEIDSGSLDEHSVEALAMTLGVSSRHLRRAMEAELGVSPIEYAQTRRLALAKQLLHDTTLPLTDVAFAAGFGSVRRFNALFKKTFARAPSEVRRTRLARANEGASDAIILRLEYRPPLAWESLLAFLRGRAIPGVERIEGGGYRRTVRVGSHVGWLSVRHADGEAPVLLASVSTSLVPRLTTIVARLRALFDLDAQPHVITEHLRRDVLLRPLLARAPGLRLPGAFDPFEMAVRAVLGQQVSVKGATTLCGRLVDAFGTPVALGDGAPEGLRAVFPTAAELARVPLAKLRTIGLPEARAATILGLASNVSMGHIDLSGGIPPETSIEALESLPGIGPWTAHYLAMRALRWPDAFVAGDLGVRKALGMISSRAAEERAEPWRPWRAYAVMLLWSSLSLPAR
jgi:AraC family transcriptional regulator, regulatory protein of adaptative response / DNA-3-methyladenine glycosylase II